jgi:hypothetical protein
MSHPLRPFEFTVGALEDGVVTALNAALLKNQAPSGYVSEIATYSGEMATEQLIRALAGQVRRFPLILVNYAEGEDTPQPATAPVLGQPRIYRHDCTLAVACASNDARGENARRRGAAGAKGVYHMISDVRETLGGLVIKAQDGEETILITREPLKCAGVENIVRLPEITAYVVYFETYLKFIEADRSAQGPLVQELVFTVDNTFQKGDSNLPGVVLE